MCQSGSWQEIEGNLQWDSEESLTRGLFTEVWITKKMASTQGRATSGSHFYPLAWKGQGSKSHQSLVRARGRVEEPPARGYTQRTTAHCQTAWWSRGSEVGEADTPWPLCLPVFLGLCRKPEGKGAWGLQSTAASFQRHKAGQQGRGSRGRARGNRT